MIPHYGLAFALAIHKYKRELLDRSEMTSARARARAIGLAKIPLVFTCRHSIT